MGNVLVAKKRYQKIRDFFLYCSNVREEEAREKGQDMKEEK